jgi:hypothetical protein
MSLERSLTSDKVNATENNLQIIYLFKCKQEF